MSSQPKTASSPAQDPRVGGGGYSDGNDNLQLGQGNDGNGGNGVRGGIPVYPSHANEPVGCPRAHVRSCQPAPPAPPDDLDNLQSSKCHDRHGGNGSGTRDSSLPTYSKQTNEPVGCPRSYTKSCQAPPPPVPRPGGPIYYDDIPQGASGGCSGGSRGQSASQSLRGAQGGGGTYQPRGGRIDDTTSLNQSAYDDSFSETDPRGKNQGNNDGSGGGHRQAGRSKSDKSSVGGGRSVRGGGGGSVDGEDRLQTAFSTGSMYSNEGGLDPNNSASNQYQDQSAVSQNPGNQPPKEEKPKKKGFSKFCSLI